MPVRRDYGGGLVKARQDAIIGIGREGSQRGWVEPLDDEPDAERQLPNELRDDHEAPQHAQRLEDPEQYAHETGEEHRTRDEPQYGHAPWNQAGAVHQVAQDQPVADAHREAGPEQERPTMERDQRPTDGDERGAQGRR